MEYVKLCLIKVLVTKVRNGEMVPEVNKCVWLADFEGGNSELVSTVTTFRFRIICEIGHP